MYDEFDSVGLVLSKTFLEAKMNFNNDSKAFKSGNQFFTCSRSSVARKIAFDLIIQTGDQLFVHFGKDQFHFFVRALSELSYVAKTTHCATTAFCT